MKLNRLAVIDRIDTLIEEGRQAHYAAHEQKVAARQKALAEWKTTHAPDLLAELRRVADIVRKGRYPETELIEGGWSNRKKWWGDIPAAPKVPTEYVPNSKLTRLRELLAAATDEYVSTSEIRSLGFQPSIFINA